jgi:hypothetical protein
MRARNRGKVRKALAVMAMSLAGLAIWYVWMLFGPASRSLDLRVHVVDAQSNKPLNAHVAVYAWDYGIMDSNPRVFVGTTGPNGEFRLEAPIDCAVRHLTVCAWNRSFTKYAVTARATFASNLMPGVWFADARNDIPSMNFTPNYGTICLALSPTPAAEIGDKQQDFKDAVDRADITQRMLRRSTEE